VVLWAVIDESDDPDLREQARALITRRGSPPYRVCHAAIGEAFAGICLERPDGLEGAARQLDEYVNRRGRIEVYGIPRGLSEDLHRLIIRLHDADPHLDPIDATIVGTACIDEDCANLYTNDATLLQSIRLKEIARGYHTRIQPF
jgi:hypothetical protein